jgi:hypothetical protein
VSQYVIQPTTAPSSSGTTEKGFVAKMKHSKRRMVVFYGSQTGLVYSGKAVYIRTCMEGILKGEVSLYR